MHYAAFISYNHKDRAAATWLHRALEAYRFPKRLHGRSSAVGLIEARLPPVFQDRAELATSSDLAASVRAALDQASSLIVICSPNAARSRWVNEEIRHFTALGRRASIRCLIVDGEPNAADPARECLPPALFDDGGQEPLAADIRPGGDGRASARLKLLAGITGLDYDELRQREQARRTRRLAIATTVLAIAFLGAAALATYALFARQDAIEQRDLARRKTLTAERTVDFVKSMFVVADPSEAKGASVTAREIVDRAAARVGRELVGEPLVRAELTTTLGEVYANLGLLKQSDGLLTAAMRIPGLDPALRARQQVALAELRNWQADDAGAAAAYARALALARDPSAGNTHLMTRILAGYGETLGFLDRPGQAERAARAALRLDRMRGSAGETDVARDLEALGKVLAGADRLDEARRAYAAALDIRLRRQGATHPRAFQDMNDLGAIAYLQGDAAAAEGYFRHVLPVTAQVLGTRHPEYGLALNNLARMEIERRAYAAALPRLRQAVAIERSARAAGTQELVFPLFNLALALRGVGRDGEAIDLLEEGRRIAADTGHRNLAPILTEQADMACQTGNRARAEALLSQARPLTIEAYPTEPWRLAWVDLVASSCRNTRLPAAARNAILQRWSADTHHGARALSAD